MDIRGAFDWILEPEQLTFALVTPSFGLSRPGSVHRIWSDTVLYGWSVSLLLALFFFRSEDFLLAETVNGFCMR